MKGDKPALTLTQLSRSDFDGDSGPDADTDEISSGALQRIAYALEIIVKYQDGPWQRRALDAENRLKSEKRRVAGLRGYIKRLRRR